MSEISLDQYDKGHPILHINRGSQTTALRIRRADSKYLWVDFDQIFQTQVRFDAFIVARDQRGIIQFTATAEIDKQETDTKFDVVKILADSNSFKLSNRRQFFRHKLSPKVQATLINSFGDTKNVTIFSLSAGGIAFTSKDSLLEDEIYLLKISGKYDVELDFAVQILSPRSLGVSIQNENEMKSANAYAAFFMTSKKQTHFPVITEKHVSAIIKMINSKIRQEQTIKK